MLVLKLRVEFRVLFIFTSFKVVTVAHLVVLRRLKVNLFVKVLVCEVDRLSWSVCSGWELRFLITVLVNSILLAQKLVIVGLVQVRIHLTCVEWWTLRDNFTRIDYMLFHNHIVIILKRRIPLNVHSLNQAKIKPSRVKSRLYFTPINIHILVLFPILIQIVFSVVGC